MSVDASVRGLVNDNLAPELQSKAFIKVPASAALSDTDGSESLWIRITPNGADISQFSFTGVDYFSASDNSYIIVRAGDVSSLEISMPAGNGGYSDSFNIEAIAVENSYLTGSNFTDLAEEIVALVEGTNSSAYEIVSETIQVKFLQPAKSPTLSISIRYDSQQIELTETGYFAEFQVTITDKQATDVVTILATGVPAVQGEQTKFYRFDSELNDYIDIGAPSEVSGVWVFSYQDLADSDGNPYDLRIGLPANYAYSVGSADMEFTAFAVDELGLTNAKSNAASSPIDLVGSDFSEGVPADAADPIVIDTSGNGLSFVSQVDGVDFDINADGFTETLGWLDGVDDAFLVMLQKCPLMYQ